MKKFDYNDEEEFKKNLELQKKILDEKINPILELYLQKKITKTDFIDRLAEAFKELELEY